MFGKSKLKAEIERLKGENESLQKSNQSLTDDLSTEQIRHKITSETLMCYIKKNTKLEETISHYEIILSDCYVRDSKGRFKRFGEGNIFLLFKVYKKDLIGSLKNFPIEIVELMLKRQYEQKGNTDIKIFQDSRFSSKWGFRWDLTKEGYNFWAEVISGKNFNLFFEKYPKKINNYDK